MQCCKGSLLHSLPCSGHLRATASDTCALVSRGEHRRELVGTNSVENNPIFTDGDFGQSDGISCPSHPWPYPRVTVHRGSPLPQSPNPKRPSSLGTLTICWPRASNPIDEKGHFRASQVPPINPLLDSLSSLSCLCNCPILLEKVSLAQPVISLSMTLLRSRHPFPWVWIIHCESLPAGSFAPALTAHYCWTSLKCSPCTLPAPSALFTGPLLLLPGASFSGHMMYLALVCVSPGTPSPPSGHFLSVPPQHEHIPLFIRNNGFCFSSGYENKSFRVNS